MWIFSKATRLPQKKKSEFDHLLNTGITNIRLPSKQSSNVCSLLPLRTWIQRARGSIVSVISSWFSCIFTFELIYHAVRKSKQDEESPLWRETKPWLSSQTKANSLPVVWKTYLENGCTSSQLTHPSWHIWDRNSLSSPSLIQIADWWKKYIYITIVVQSH